MQPSCKDWYDEGEVENGRYSVLLDGDEEDPREVWCNMEEHGGGWTAIYAAHDVSAVADLRCCRAWRSPLPLTLRTLCFASDSAAAASGT